MTSAAREPTSEYSKVHHAGDEGWQCMRLEGRRGAGKGNPTLSSIGGKRSSDVTGQ